jgi:sulfur carrier protein ThiS adenylyltransferase
MKIGIAGVGGIGSNVAVHLVRSGVREITIVDFDCVEASNLNRQFYFHDQIGQPKVEMLTVNLKRIRPDLQIQGLHQRLDSGNAAAAFADCGLVVEGLDGQNEKKMLLEALSPEAKPMVAACGVAGHRLDGITTRRLAHCVVVGDFSTDYRQAGLYAPKVAAIAAMMANIVLEKAGYYD